MPHQDAISVTGKHPGGGEHALPAATASAGGNTGAISTPSGAPSSQPVGPASANPAAISFNTPRRPVASPTPMPLFPFGPSGSAPSDNMCYVDQYPTPIRPTGQATVEAIGGRLFRGVIWTMLLPVIVAAHGIATTISTAAGLIVVVFAAETYRRNVGSLEPAAICDTAAGPVRVAP
jgi:hypothetical protein